MNYLIINWATEFVTGIYYDDGIIGVGSRRRVSVCLSGEEV